MDDRKMLLSGLNLFLAKSAIGWPEDGESRVQRQALHEVGLSLLEAAEIRQLRIRSLPSPS
jgi:hypothetical protein